MLKDYIIAEINHVSRSLVDGTLTEEDIENGIEVETPAFVLKISIDRGMCEECELHPIAYDTICEECNKDRIDMQRAIDFTNPF